MQTRTLSIAIVRLLLCLMIGSIVSLSNSAPAQTPDGETPAQEDVCSGEVGAAYGLCNAYREAMDCDGEYPQASDAACQRVFDQFVKIAGVAPPPCECVGGGGGGGTQCR